MHAYWTSLSWQWPTTSETFCHRACPSLFSSLPMPLRGWSAQYFRTCMRCLVQHLVVKPGLWNLSHMSKQDPQPSPGPPVSRINHSANYSPSDLTFFLCWKIDFVENENAPLYRRIPLENDIALALTPICSLKTMAGPRYTQVFAVWGYIPSCSWNVGQCPLRVACAWKHAGETKWVLLPKHGPAPMCSQYMGNGQLSPLMVFHQHVRRLCHDDVEGKKYYKWLKPTHFFIYNNPHSTRSAQNVVCCWMRLPLVSCIPLAHQSK